MSGYRLLRQLHAEPKRNECCSVEKLSSLRVEATILRRISSLESEHHAGADHR